MPPTKKPLREIPFSAIENAFTVAGYHFNGFRPGVIRRTDDLPPERHHYQIRVQVGYYEARSEITRKYDYFTTTLDGEVLSAPRGWTKDYKPARITGLDEAVAKYADPASTDRSA